MAATIGLLMLNLQMFLTQLADGASALQSEMESFAEPAAIAGVVIGFALGYFSDDGTLAKKIGYGMGYVSLILGAATFVGLFG